jgi:CRP/FNR family transcriptional regulator, cyclic AMP receptor protein
MDHAYGWPVQPPTQSAKAAKAALAKSTLSEREKLLTRIPMFSGLGKGHIRKIARITETASFPANHEIVTEGEEGDFCAVIVAGSVEVVKGGKRIATLAAGEIFGEMALIDPGLRSASVRTLTEVTAIRVQQKFFTQVVNEDPQIALGLLQVLAQRLRVAQQRSEPSSPIGEQEPA